MQDLVFSPLAIRASYDPRRISPRSDLANGYSMRFPLPLLKYNAQALAKRKPEPFDPERDYLCAAGRLITDSRGMAALLGLLASHGEMVCSPPHRSISCAPRRTGWAASAKSAAG